MSGIEGLHRGGIRQTGHWREGSRVSSVCSRRLPPEAHPPGDSQALERPDWISKSDNIRTGWARQLLGGTNTEQVHKGTTVSFIRRCLFFFLAELGPSYSIWPLSWSTHILSCSIWDLFPWAGIKPRPPVLRAHSLSHWTTKQVHDLFSWCEWIPLLLGKSYFINTTIRLGSCVDQGDWCQLL